MHDEPLRLAFYGLAASELDLFTLVRRQAKTTLVLVVDQSPMAVARRLAEIAGVQSSSNPWDLAQADLDWIVTGRLARTPAAPLQRAMDGGTLVMPAAEAARRLRHLEETRPEAAAEEPALTAPFAAEVSVAEVPAAACADEQELDQESMRFPATREDWAPPIVDFAPDVPAVAAPEQAETEPRPASDERAGALEDIRMRPVSSPASMRAEALGRGPGVGSRFLSPAEEDVDPSRVVGWALDGMMSSVGSGWGVALAREDGGFYLVERGIDLRSSRPDLFEWLRNEVERGEEPGRERPAGFEALAWVPLRAGKTLVGAMVLGKGAGDDVFSASDMTWLEKVGERIASILCSAGSSHLLKIAETETVAPAAVWAAPVIERAVWARGWLRDQFGAAGCWLFATPEGSSEPQLIDEYLGSSAPPFLGATIREAMERSETQVWLQSDEKKALVIQPLGPWGVAWSVMLEGLPWPGDGRATLARLKKAAATLARLLKST